MKETRFARVDEWLPTSSKMVLDYCKAKGYAVPKHRKTKKPTTDDAALERLIQKYPIDPVLPLVREARAIQKAKGYLSDAFVGNDLRFHSEFTFHPETSRLSCLPTSAEILTRVGWKTYQQLIIGEEVLAYNLANDRLIWTPLLNLHAGEDKLGYVRFRQTTSQPKGTHVKCTPNHKWVISDGKFKGLVEAQDLDKIRMTKVVKGALNDGAKESSLTSAEAALMGWAITDGYIQEVSAGSFRLTVILRKQQSIDAFAKVAENFVHSRSQYYTNTGFAGKEYKKTPVTRFCLGVKIFTPIYAKATPLMEKVSGLDKNAQIAMWEAMVEADGTVRDYYTHERQEIRFGKQKQLTLDVFCALAVYLGRTVTLKNRRAKGKYPKGYNPVFTDIHVWKDEAGCATYYPPAKEAELEPVWCPETACGTWVTRCDGVVTITGNSRRPNLTNQPNPDRQQGAEARAARKIRGTIVASPGMILLERDFKSQESLLLGYFANDPTYMRLARLGNYAYFTGLKVGKPVDLSLPDPEVLKLLKQIKKDHTFDYQLFKVIILALGYGEQTYAMARHLEPNFINKAKEAALSDAQSKRWWKDINGDPFHDPRVTGLVAELAFAMAKTAAENYRNIYITAAPKVAQWQESTRKRAHKEKKLTNPFGMSLDFFEVYKKLPNGIWTLGAEANKALAYLPQSTGAGILKEAILTVDKELGSDPDFHMLVPVHDAIFSECKESKVAHYDAVLKQIMEAPIAALNGLTIETEAKIGYSWNWGEEE